MAQYSSDDVLSGKAKPVPGDIIMDKSGYPYKYAGGNIKQQGALTPLKGQDYLDALPAGRRGVVGQLLMGQMKFPTLSRNNTLGYQLIQDAAAVDPTFNQATYPVRQKAWEDFTSGYDSKTIAALNQAPLHALELARAFQHLHNSNSGAFGDSTLASIAGYQPLNAMGIDWANPVPYNERQIKNKTAVGDKEVSNALGAIGIAQPAVSDELATVFGGKPGTVEGIDAIRSGLPVGATPNMSNGALSTASKLLRDRQATLVAKFQKAVGPTMAKMFPIVDPRSSQALDQLDAMTRGGAMSSPAPAASATTMPRVATPADAMRLPPGTHFIDPNGVERVR